MHKEISLFFLLLFFYVCTFLSSDLLFGSWLIIFESQHRFFNHISRNLQIFDDSTNNKLEHAIGDGFLLILGLPDKTIQLNGQDLLGKSVDIGLRAVRLDFPNNNGFGDNGRFRLLCLSFFGLLLGFNGGGFVFFSFFTEKIITVISLGSGDRYGLGGLNNFSGNDWELCGINWLYGFVAHLGVSTSVDNVVYLGDSFEPGGYSGHGLAETSIENKSEWENKGGEDGDISESEALTNEESLACQVSV